MSSSDDDDGQLWKEVRLLEHVDTREDHLNALFENPLDGVPKDQLMQDVDEYVS